MASTLLLDPATWDLTIDATGNIGTADEPYSIAQDAASAIRTFLGECYWDTTIGVAYMTKIFGNFSLPLALLKQLLTDAAITASPDIASAQVLISGLNNRGISGQVQIVSTTGQSSAVNFTVLNPQGIG